MGLLPRQPPPWLGSQSVGSSPVGIVEVPFLIHTLTPALGRAGQGEVPGWKLEGAVLNTSARCLLHASIIQVRHLQLPIHEHKLPRAEVKESH